MGKKKHAEHVNHERWLVSYADLLTLLFAFFVVLFASSVSDKKKTAAMAAAMQSAFSDSGIFDAHSKAPPLAPGAGNASGTPAPIMVPLPTAPNVEGSNQSAGAVQRDIERATRGDALRNSVAVHTDTAGITISLSDAGLFASGSADLSPAALPLLRKIAGSLPARDLRVEGHTDNLPIHSARFRSNFELSTARAAAIVEALMQTARLAPSHFALAGYGEFRPAAPNTTPEGRAKNRRVDIILTGPPTPSDPATPAAPTPREAVQTVLVPVPHATGRETTVRPALAEQLAPAADRAAAK